MGRQGRDPTLKLLMHYISVEWPCDQRQLPQELHVHTGTTGKIYLLRMGLQPRVPDFSCAFHPSKESLGTNP